MLIRSTVQFYWSKVKKLDRTVYSTCLWAHGSGIVNPWADSTVVLSAKVNCRQWVTAHSVLLLLGVELV